MRARCPYLPSPPTYLPPIGGEGSISSTTCYATSPPPAWVPPKPSPPTCATPNISGKLPRKPTECTCKAAKTSCAGWPCLTANGRTSRPHKAGPPKISQAVRRNWPCDCRAPPYIYSTCAYTHTNTSTGSKMPYALRVFSKTRGMKVLFSATWGWPTRLWPRRTAPSSFIRKP